MNGLRTSYNRVAPLILAATVILCAASAFAQSGAMSPYQGEQDGVSAGGKWMMFQSEDKMTGAKRVRFELLAENFFREDPNYKPRVELICENGKFKLASFTPAVRVPPNRPGFWGQPQLESEVRVDEVHYFKGWNWEGRGRFLQMDKGTARGLIGAHVFNIAIPTRSGRQIAEFQPEGLDIQQVRSACDLTPKKPSKD
ncbi:MAG: hypothetical protein WA477_03610 [Candidatus Sulfotelmatobacter sp.]